MYNDICECGWLVCYQCGGCHNENCQYFEMDTDNDESESEQDVSN